jgi:hypothetical protein
MNHFKLLRRNCSIAFGLLIVVIMGSALSDWLMPGSNSSLSSLWTFASNYADKLATGLFIAVTLPLAFQSTASVERD